jgi:HlyD family secretion protein
VIAVLVVVGIVTVRQRRAVSDKPTIRTAKVERGTVTASVSANGVLDALTTVEVKSNVGGQVVKLAVDEGDEVRAGQLIARIDPSDPLANLQQAQADFTGAQAKVTQSRQGYEMQRVQTPASVAAAEQAVEAARQKLAQAEKQAEIQPQLTDAAIKQAESNLASAQAGLDQTKSATTPQKLAAAQSGYDQAKAGYDLAERDLARQQALFDKGFVAKGQVDAAEQQYASMKAQLESAKNKLDTVKDETDQDLQIAEAKVEQARGALDSAKANRAQDELKQQDVAAARAALSQAQASLESAKAGSYQELMKGQDVAQSQAQLEHSKWTVKNAQQQVDYTTIVSPCDGVVVKKYVEPGGIVTAGRSAIGGTGAGVTIVDIADITRMVVLVNVDETDISQIRFGQVVDVSLDAYPDERFSGTVTKIAPQAVVNQNVTTIPVTVELTRPDKRFRPQMNATCDFITDRKENVIYVPNEAVTETAEGAEVTVLENGKQIPRPVKVGLTGDHNTEILSGLQEGEKVVTAVVKAAQGQQRQSSPGGSMGGGGRGGMMRGGPPPF